MSLLGKQKREKETKEEQKTPGRSAIPEEARKAHLENVIIRPRITEKATESAEQGVYVFEVSMDANKPLVKKAVKHIYGVEPVKVNTTRHAPRIVTRLGRKGSKAGLKKAYVYLKKGEEIEVV